MPFYDDSVAAGLPIATPEPLPVTVPSAPFSRLFDAAMRRDNIVGSITEAATQPPMGAFDPSFDPWSDVKGYEGHLRSFIGANNRDDVLNVKARIDKEQRDRELQENGGWRGAAALLAAGTMDPVNLIPLGQVRAITRGGRALEGAIRGATAFGAGTALQEVGLQGTQITRPAAESLMNIGSATVMGGILGGAVGALTRPTMQTLRGLGDSSAIGGMIFDRELAGNLPGRRNLEEAAEVYDAPAIQRATAAAGGDALKVAEDLHARIDDEMSTGGIVEHRNQGGEKVRINAIDEAGVMTDANGARLTLDDATGPGHSLEIRLPADTGRGITQLVDDPLTLHFRGDLSAARAAEIRDSLATLDPVEAARLRNAGVPLDPELWKVIAANLEKAEASREGGLEVVIDQAQYLRRGGDLDTVSEREAFAVINRAMQAEVARGGDPNRFLDDAIAAGLGDARVPGWVEDWKQRLLYAMPAPAEPGRALAGQLAGVQGPIVDEVTRVLTEAGRPAAEARAYGALAQVRYQARAARLGTGESAEDLFRRDFPEVARGEDGELQPGELEQRAPGDERISTRVPWAVGQEEAAHATSESIVGLEGSQEATRAFEKNAQLVARYPGVRIDGGQTAAAIAEQFITHLKDNILDLFDRVAPEIRERSKLWYEGANRIANDWAQTYGHQPRAVAAALAALSPQKDWFQNVDLARRILTTLRDQQDTVLTPEMRAYAERYIGALEATGKPGPAASAVRLREMLGDFATTPLRDIQTPYEKAVWIRWFDEAHNDRSYPIVTPEGGFAETATTARGAPQRVAWGGFGEIEKAVSVLEDDSVENISRMMGGNHKVRNFYNNIIDPNAPFGDVTIDTHAIAADLMRPLSGNHREVAHGLGLGEGAADHAGTGNRGLYGLHAEAYRRAASERNVLPREMQSITWEAIRGLFSPEQKRDAKLIARVEGIWDDYKQGRIDAAEARQRVVDEAGGINPPEWFGRGAEADVAARDAARPRDVPGDELGRGAAGPVDGGTGGAGAGTAAPGAVPGRGELEQAGRGKIRLSTESERALITLFRDADASTFGHEISHHWLTELFTDAADPRAPAALRKHADDVRAWLEIKEGEGVSVAAQEKFATGFEQYLREGRAPTPELATAFRQFREWLVKIYQTITGLGEPISPEVRALFDQFLTVEEKAAATPTAAGGSLSAASPHATLDQETIASALGIERALVRVSPTLRTGTSPSVVTRRTSMALADQPLDLKKNVEGIPTAQSAESLIKQFQAPLAEAEVGIDDLFTRYRLGRSRRVFDIARLEARDMLGAPEGAMSYSEFRQAIGRAMRRGDQAVEPEVAEAAQLLRRTVFDPLKQRAIDAGLMPEDIDTKTAESYLMRVYDANKIVAQRGQFSDVITRWLAGEQAKKDTIRTRVELLLGEYELLQSRAVPRVTRIAEIRDELEDLVTSWEGKTSQAAKSALARRAEEEATRTPEQGRLAAADKPVIDAAEAIANTNTRLEEGDLRDIARQIIDRILGSPVGRLPYDMEVPHPSGGPPRPDRAAPRGPLAQRSFMIPDELIEPWLESDSREIARMYTRTMAPDVVLAERFGRTDMEAQLQEIMADYEVLRQGKSEAEQTRLHNQMQADLRDIAAMRDRMRGTYALPADPNGLGNRAFHVIRDLNYLRLLGGMTISALPDMGRLVMQHGFSRVFGDAIVPMISGFREFRLAANEAKLSGTAVDMVLDSRAMSMADMLDDYGRWSKYERGLKGLTDRFGLVTLMAPWNAAMKQIAGVIGQTRTLEAIEALVAGQPLRQAERTRLASLGIGPEMAERIDAQFKAHGQKQDNGTWWANSQDWTDRNAIEAFRSALNKEIDTTIVTKGQEVPLWMSGGGTLLPGNVGKMIGQFRSFGLAAAQRVMMAGLQKRDMATLNGALMMVGLGMMVYYIRSVTNPKAQPLPDITTPDGLARWIREGVDISGLTGYLFDVHNMIEKASGGGIGISRLTGGPAQSRYANRNTLESILGPTAGLVQDAGQLLGAATKGEWKAGDSSRVRRMIPFQNLIGLRHVFDAAEHGINQVFGIKEPAPRR